MFVLDTNAVIALFKGKPNLMQALRKRQPDEIATSAIVLHELFFGAFKSARLSENVARVDAMRFHVLPFDAGDARAAGEIRATLAKAGAPIGSYDVLIAGQALARGHTLVTRNTGEFSRVAGLKIEDWETPAGG